MKGSDRTFTIRVDIESDKGIKRGIPELLDLLKKYGIKASFYLVMGGESNIFEFLRYNKKMESSAERSIKIWTLPEKLRMILFPGDFVKANEQILQRIIKEGHELGIHGWKHREWTRGLEKIDAEKKIRQAINKYEKIFGQTPVSWASPGFNINKEILEILSKSGIRYISDMEGNKIEKYEQIKNVPVTICGEKRTPVIEWLISQGKTDDEIIEHIRKEIEKHKIISFYIHDLFEARFKLALLERVFWIIQDKKIKNKRIIDY